MRSVSGCARHRSLAIRRRLISLDLFGWVGKIRIEKTLELRDTWNAEPSEDCQMSQGIACTESHEPGSIKKGLCYKVNETEVPGHLAVQ